MSRAESRHTARLRWAAYAGMFVFGIVMALLGAILPALADRLRFAVSGIGMLFLWMNFAMLLCSLALGPAMDRFGMKPPLALGPLLVAAALILIVRANAFAGLLPAVALLGIGGGALNGATNTLVADLHDDPKRKSAALNLLGVFFGFGALFLPFAIGALLARFTVAPLLLTAALLCAAAGVYALALRFPPPKQAHALPLKEMPRFLRSPLVLTLACLLFFESGIEFTMGGFISTYLMRDIAVSSLAIASWILAGYWASLMISRVVLSRAALGVNPNRVLMVCAVCACCGSALTALAPTSPIAAFAILLTGCSLAGIFPTALGIAGSRFQSHSGTVFGILFTVALTGGIILPWLAGQVAGAAGLRWVFGMVAAAFAAILVLSCLLARAKSQV